MSNADKRTSHQRLSDYERNALKEIAEWRKPSTDFISLSARKAGKVVDEATDLLREIPGVNWTLDTLVAGILKSINELAQDLVWKEAVYAELQGNGMWVTTPKHVHVHDLEKVDQLTRRLANKYRALGAAEGASTGAIGAAGILPDVVALTAINLRAAGEYATYYGFDVQTAEERLYALEVLNAAAGGGPDLSKNITLKPISRATQSIAKQQAMESAGQLAITRSIKKAVERLGIHLTKQTMAQLVPIAGALVSGSFNLYFTSKVCTTSYHVYRERFLIERYGAELVALA